MIWRTFINGVEAIQEIPNLEIILKEAHTGGEMELRYQTGRERNSSCNISNMVKKWSRPQQLYSISLIWNTLLQ